jgi:transcription elongation factor
VHGREPWIVSIPGAASGGEAASSAATAGWLSATREPGLRWERGGSHNRDAVVQFPRHADPWGKRDAVERAYEARGRRAVPPGSSADADAQP